MVVAIVMVLTFSSPSEEYGYEQSFIFVSLLLPVLAGTSYLIAFFLVPRFLLKRHFFQFTLYTLYAIIGAAWLETMIVMGMLMVIYEYNVYLVNPRIQDISYLTGTMVLVILPFLAIHITQQWYKEREENVRLEQEKLELELFARQKELDYLREQMHPHFLFNALNSLYGLTLEKSDEAPELVLKVSDLLDYMLYQSSKPLVALADEIEHINHYLEIQQIRFGDRLNLSLNIDEFPDIYQIAPMLLLPFVENSFKHGVSATTRQSWVAIHLSIEQEVLNFAIANSVPVPKRSTSSNTGVGLTNVKKRLELLYGDKYELNTHHNKEEYRVELSIPLENTTHEKVEMHNRG